MIGFLAHREKHAEAGREQVAAALEAVGFELVNVYNEAGIGFASHISETLDMSALTPPKDTA